MFQFIKQRFLSSSLAMINQIIRYKPIINFIKKNKYKNILEIGSWSQGIGKFFRIPFTGMDLSINDYGEKQKEINKQMNYIEWSALAIPAKNNEYDFALSLDMIEHIDAKDRLTAFREIIRVSSKACIVWFPCGDFAYHNDQILYKYQKKLWHKVHGRLEEHIELWTPSEEEIDTILETIKKEQPNLTITKQGNGNIYLRLLITYIESSSKIGKFFSIYFSHIVNLFSYEYKSQTPYRFIYTITKWTNNEIQNH